MKPFATFIQPGLPAVQNGTQAESIFRRCSSQLLNRRCEAASRRSSFVTPSALPVTEGQLIQTRRRTVDRFRACAEASGADHQNIHSDKQPEYTPVEDGVILPKVKGGEDELRAQAGWLEIEIRNWLDNEWPDNNAARTHNQLAHRTAQLYERLRAEGIHDVGTLMLGIGTALEGEDFSQAYVDAWNIANKLSDLLIQGLAPGRTVDDLKSGGDKQQTISPEATWSVLDDPHEGKDTGRKRRAASPSLADGFERYRFLQMVLDGSASKALIDGAVAVAMGFNYNMANGTWTNEDVTDDHFKQFGNLPPDVLGNEFSAPWTDTLKYLDEQVKADDEDGAKEEGLNVVIETLHGMEATKLQSTDEYDHSFHKRVAVVKWLHLLGGF